MSSSCCSCGCVGEGRRPRRNGWDCPWHPQQILAWSLLVFFAAMYFGFYVFYVPLCWRPAAITLPLVVMVILVVCLLVASSINPGDDNVRRKFQQLSRRPIPQFDRSRHQHVIEDYKCHLCECTVEPRAKHCRLCNKCISDFDHHCKWLNNCVGGRNYRWFMGALSSALLSTTTLSVMSFVFFVLFFIARSSVCYLDCGGISVCSSHFHYVNGTGNITSGSSSENYTLDTRIHILSRPVPEEVFPVVAAVNFCLTIVATFLLCQLLLFHLYLFYRGMSTYDYITRKRESAPDRGTLCCYGNQCQHHNKVKPSNGSFVGSESLSERSKTGESAHAQSGDNLPMQEEDIFHSPPLEEVISFSPTRDEDTPHSPTQDEDISYSPTQYEDIFHIPPQEKNISHSLPPVNSRYTSVVISNSLINNNRQTSLTPGQENIQASEEMKEQHHQLSSEHASPRAVLLDMSQTAYSDSRC